DIGVIETTKGKITIMFFPQVAPNHVANFIKLSKEGFYNGTRFHRCIPGFMIQGGDPNSRKMEASDLWGTGGPQDEKGNRISVNAEFSKLKHLRGVLSMARSSDPNSAGSQFFVMHANAPSLDGKYSAFGKVIEGIEIVDEIVKTGPTDRQLNGSVPPNNAVEISKITIAKWPITN
ncbi:MAG: peptidylprolyl isomerase, partial [Fimbriimonadaceae bacterium]